MLEILAGGIILALLIIIFWRELAILTLWAIGTAVMWALTFAIVMNVAPNPDMNAAIYGSLIVGAVTSFVILATVGERR